MYRTVIILMTAGLILAAGFLHGKITDRWGDSHEMTEAVERLKHLKSSFGEWTSQEVEMNPRHLQVAEIVGHVNRQYVNKTTGERVSILLICGRPGPISVHTPDICFQGAGFVMGPKSQQAMKGDSNTRPPEFWAARFTKEPQPGSLHVLWTWSNGGRWMAPDNPRLIYYRSKALYKLYIVHETRAQEGPVVDDTIQRFSKDFFPALQQMMTDQTASPTSN